MRSLSAMAGTDVVQDLVDSFLSELPDLLAAVTSAVGAGRLEELRKAAHALKGAASTVGASGFAAKCKHLQDSAEGSKFDLALRDAQDLLAAAEALPDLLRTAAKMQPDSVRASE
jgi:HPt (histidine-containing phosphotransfer) domain-containing protein